MSKIVSWGRWPVAAIMAVSGFSYLFNRIFSDVTEAIYGGGTLYPVYVKILSSLPFFASAWGILNWQRWGCTLAMILGVVEFAALGVEGTVGILHGHGLDAGTVPAMVLAVTPPIWVSLPSVREEYVRRNQPA
jgi:hypothetical protein